MTDLSQTPLVQTPLPPTMRAIDPAEAGGPDVLQLVERPLPVPGPGEVLIRVHAAGVNRPDVLQRMGLYPMPPGAPTIMGLEAAGEVVALGDGAAGIAIGDPVAALVAGGAYADYVAAPAVQCLPVPPGMRFAEAATLPETWFTVWANLHDLANAQAGETLLVHGGTSGIGVTAIDFARVRGMQIIVTCGTDTKCEAALALGATHALNYNDGDFAPIVRELTGGRGVDVVLDMVGGEYFPRNLASLRDGGRHVSIAFQKGNRLELDVAFLMRRRLHVTGSLLRPRSVAEKGAIAAALAREIWPHFSDGTLKSHLFREFPLNQADDAHRLMESGGHVGKIALSLI
ncbi:MAG: NAD(P)H-quinone oxidoreductase [Sandaracinobacteroides sp.]